MCKGTEMGREMPSDFFLQCLDSILQKDQLIFFHLSPQSLWPGRWFFMGWPVLAQVLLSGTWRRGIEIGSLRELRGMRTEWVSKGTLITATQGRRERGPGNWRTIVCGRLYPLAVWLIHGLACDASQAQGFFFPTRNWQERDVFAAVCKVARLELFVAIVSGFSHGSQLNPGSLTQLNLWGVDFSTESNLAPSSSEAGGGSISQGPVLRRRPWALWYFLKIWKFLFYSTFKKNENSFFFLSTI